MAAQLFSVQGKNNHNQQLAFFIIFSAFFEQVDDFQSVFHFIWF